MKDKQSPPDLSALRHSLEHVLTWAVLQTWGVDKITPALGPATADGFYFDFDKTPAVEIGEKDFARLEKAMAKVIKANWTFKKFSVSLKQAAAFFATNSYKLEWINELKQTSHDDPAPATFYSLAPAEKNAQLTAAKLAKFNFRTAFEAGYFIDLCRGPHVAATGQLKAFKLLRVASAYWRGDEKQKQLTRIYGTGFASQKELTEHLAWLEEAKKRDHKRIGRQQDLFSFHPESPGAVFWHAKGMALWETLEAVGAKIKHRYGYQKIKTPELARSVLWQTSGHWDHYKDDMFVFDVDDDTYCLKPMDCPFNILIFQTGQKSYRDLPLRYTEVGHVFRNEKSGELNGLFRVREITQDDSHLLIREDQILEEVKNLLLMVKEYYQKLGLPPEYFLSTRPDDFMGEIKTWNKAEADLINVLESQQIAYGVKEKDGAFYGPKIDVNIKDSLGRSWQVATIQLDFQLPGRFGCEYIDEKGQARVPVMIHAAIFGSYERMIGVLLEHYAGRLPLWLAPVQVIILPIADRHLAFAKQVQQELTAAGARVELDERSERLPAKIRAAQVRQIPLMLIIGDKEVANQSVSLRRREGGEEKSLDLAAVKALLTTETR